MREILFRGKRADNGEWVEGGLVVKTDPLLEISHCFILAQGRGDSFVTWYLVDPATVGQYTGLTDKNGKRIFEGDVLHTARDGGRTYFVLFDDDLCAFVGRVYESNIFVTFEGDGERYEVIGNIHDNPELLNGGITNET